MKKRSNVLGLLAAVMASGLAVSGCLGASSKTPSPQQVTPESTRTYALSASQPAGEIGTSTTFTLSLVGDADASVVKGCRFQFSPELAVAHGGGGDVSVAVNTLDLPPGVVCRFAAPWHEGGTGEVTAIVDEEGGARATKILPYQVRGPVCSAGDAPKGLVAQALGVDMYIMMDRSGSMGTDCVIGGAATGSRWCNAINSLSSYFNSAESAGNAAALQYFDLEGVGQCDGSGFDVAAFPASGSAYQTLPTNAFDPSLDQQSPLGNTPTEGALRGIVRFTSKPENRRAGHKTIGVLITDGTPSTCDTNPAHLQAILQQHFEQTGTPTYLIGMDGADFGIIEQLATGGNAPIHPSNTNGLEYTCGNVMTSCRHWNVGSGDANVLAQALASIQASAAGCSYALPPTASARPVDPAEVLVQYVPSDTDAPHTLPRVADAAACAGAPDGYYFDSPTNPTAITLCRSQCSDGSVNVKYCSAR